MAEIKVTVVDQETGDTDTAVLKPGEFVVVCANPIRVTHEQRYRNGTVVLTLKREAADA